MPRLVFEKRLKCKDLIYETFPSSSHCFIRQLLFSLQVAYLGSMTEALTLGCVPRVCAAPDCIDYTLSTYTVSKLLA